MDNLPSINNYTSVIDINITAVCSLNGTEYQCRCDDQYLWPCGKCTQYGSCNNITDSLCRCINAVPNDGHFCQPISELTDNSTCPAITPTAISASTQTSTTTETSTANATLNSTTTTSIATSTTTQSTTTTTTTADTHVLTFTLAINEVFDTQLSDQTSTKYQKYKRDIESAIDLSYQTVTGYMAGSARVTNFRSGSVLADFSISTTSVNLDLVSANENVANDLQSQGFNSITLNIVNETFDCFDNVFGAGNVGVESTGNCSGGMVGYQVAQCTSPNIWKPIENYCVLPIFKNLQDTAKTLQLDKIPQFMVNLSTNALFASENITDSTATILTIVDILNTISNLSQTILISQPVMKNFLETTDVIGSDGAQSTWMLLNSNSTTKNASSELLKSTEKIATRLSDNNFSIKTKLSSLDRTSITAPFSGTFGINSTTQINIPVASAQTSLTVIISSAFNNILPVRNLTYDDGNQTGTIINGDVAVIETNTTINKISLSLEINNTTLGNPQCVFWNFNLLNGIGGWDSTGCLLKSLENETKRVTCECNHTTSFSILMSPFTPDKDLAIILDYITYIGVAISLGCLVLCLLIEIIIWKSVTRNDTSYMRHVSIVNIALSLLIADICFIIGAAVVNRGEGPCSAATFFMHFFYLALFFWMLLSALLLLYRTLMVFSRMSKGTMMAIAFSVGYGAPLIIAVVTVASTAGQHGYIQKNYNCWLNWSQTKALLAFVIPALTIVAINFLVLIVVLCKMLRRGASASIQQDEKHPLVVIARCVAILTPLFGLTWGFGIGTLVSPNRGIHIVFAFFNSLQGFFILLFGILLDSKVREALTGTFSLKNFSSNRTRSTSGGPLSSSGFPFFQRIRQRNAYNISSGGLMSSSNSATDT
ncbi:adhesion G-protein coupled receptor F1-like [Clarias gariepinus]